MISLGLVEVGRRTRTEQRPAIRSRHDLDRGVRRDLVEHRQRRSFLA